MKIELSKHIHIPTIMAIIRDAKEHLASQKIDQWQNGYPNESQVLNDIQNNESYIIKNSKEIISDDLIVPQNGHVSLTSTNTETSKSLSVATLIGGWDENNTNDVSIVKALVHEF